MKVDDKYSVQKLAEIFEKILDRNENLHILKNVAKLQCDIKNALELAYLGFELPNYAIKLLLQSRNSINPKVPTFKDLRYILTKPKQPDSARPFSKCDMSW